MNTGNVTGSGATNAYYQNLYSGKTGGKNEAAAATSEAASDQYTAAGVGAPTATYSKGPANVQRLYDIAEARYASMRSAVASLIGVGDSGQNGQAFWAMAANGNVDNFRVDAATQKKAQELTGEDGYFGVKKTTERIMEFARALAGDGADEKTIENLRKGAQAGFDYVANLFGGFDKLPQITKDTYDSVMGEFDNWISGDKLTES